MSGKARTWYSVQIEYNTIDNGVSVFRIPNLDGPSLYKFREDVFTHGAKKYVKEGTWEVISPYRIRSFFIYQQKHFFNAAEEDKPLIYEPPKPK